MQAAAASPTQPPPMGTATFPAAAVTTKDIYPMYLYNGFGHLAAAAAAASMWPSSPAASAFGATPFQQSLIQLQQESWLARHHQQNAAVSGFLFNQQQQQQQPQEESSRSPASSPPRRPTAPPPVIRSPSPVASCSPHEDNVSVGGPSDELEEEHHNSSKGQKIGNGSSSSDLIKVKVESLIKAEDDTSGLQLLAEGIDRLEHNSTPSASSASSSPLKPPQRPPVRKLTSQSLTSSATSSRSPSKLGLLCDAAFLSDDEAHLRSETLSDNSNDNTGKARSRSLDSPQKNKPRTLSSEYRSPKAERNAKAFIASKSLKVSEDLHHLELTASNSHEAVSSMVNKQLQMSTPTITGIGHGLNNIRSSSGGASSGHSSNAAANGELSDRERNLRLNLADIQKKYKEKYKELQVINKKSFTSSAAVAANAANGSGVSSGGGGSPNLAKMPAPKKITRCQKNIGSNNHSLVAQTEKWHSANKQCKQQCSSR
jgi:hypothetical protein